MDLRASMIIVNLPNIFIFHHLTNLVRFRLQKSCHSRCPEQNVMYADGKMYEVSYWTYKIICVLLGESLDRLRMLPNQFAFQ